MALIFFWAVVGALTLAVLGFITAAVARASETPTQAAAYDLKVFRDQLEEVERDLARGIVSEDDALRLRTDLSRRILAADQAQKGAKSSQAMASPKNAALIALVAATTATVGFGVYLWRGQPSLPDQPLAMRLADAAELRASRPTQQEAEAEMPAFSTDGIDPDHLKLIEQLREAMKQRADDPEGLQLLARNEATLGNYPAAARAQGQLVALRGADAPISDLEFYAELLVMAAGGIVTPEAEAVLTQILQKDPKNGVARFRSGVLFLQTARPDLAFRFWAPLWEDSPDGAYWLPVLEQQLPDVAWLAGQHRYQLPQRRAPLAAGPSSVDLEAAAQMSPEERSQMVQSMVDGLMARLANEGGSAEEWAKLLRALSVIGQGDRAKDIYGEAVERFSNRPTDLALIKEAASAAGITE